MSSSNFLKPLNRCLNSRSYQNLESLSKKDEEEERDGHNRKCHYQHHTRNCSRHLSVNNSTETNSNEQCKSSNNLQSDCNTTQPNNQKLSLPSPLPSSFDNGRSFKNPNRKFTGGYGTSSRNVENDRSSSTSDQYRRHKFSMINLHKSETDVVVKSQTLSTNDLSSAWDQIQREIVKAKAAAKTVSTMNGNLYIDYKFVVELPGS